MFDKFKKAKKIKQMRDSLAQERAEYETGGVKVIVNGKMRVEQVEIGEDVDIEDAGQLIKKCTNKALQKVQKSAAKKMQQLQGE